MLVAALEPDVHRQLVPLYGARALPQALGKLIDLFVEILGRHGMIDETDLCRLCTGQRSR